MTTYSITGASGFIGRKLINVLQNEKGAKIRILIHRKKDPILWKSQNVSPVFGSLSERSALDELVEPQSIVINLAYKRNASKNYNLSLLKNLINVSKYKKIKRLIYCSTASVIGRVDCERVMEDITCHPINKYEVAKLELEKYLTEKTKNEFETVILRPTLVFGDGGSNLTKTIDDIYNNKITSYLKACLFYNRKMNLVSVENVVSAIEYLAKIDTHVDGQVYFISDEDPLNNYTNIDQLIRKKIGREDYIIPVIPLPKLLLRVLLRLKGVSIINPNQVIVNKKLIDLGFKYGVSFSQAIEVFIDNYINQQGYNNK